MIILYLLDYHIIIIILHHTPLYVNSEIDTEILYQSNISIY
jgi:hypothetical protein